MPQGRELVDWRRVANQAVRFRNKAMEKLAQCTMWRKIRIYPISSVRHAGQRHPNTHRGQDCERYGGVVHSQLADVLDDHDEQRCAGRSAGVRAHMG